MCHSQYQTHRIYTKSAALPLHRLHGWFSWFNFSSTPNRNELKQMEKKIENLKIQVYFSGIPEEWERCFCWTLIRRTKTWLQWNDARRLLNVKCYPWQPDIPMVFLSVSLMGSSLLLSYWSRNCQVHLFYLQHLFYFILATLPRKVFSCYTQQHYNFWSNVWILKWLALTGYGYLWHIGFKTFLYMEVKKIIIIFRCV